MDVFQPLINPAAAEKKFAAFVFFGVFWAAISSALALAFFKPVASIAVVALSTIACIPSLYSIFKFESQKLYFESGNMLKDLAWLFGQHKNVLAILLSLFIGFVLGFLGVYMVNGELLFADQKNTILEIQGAFLGLEDFLKIFLNNAKVLALSFVFSLLFGAGALFIIVWNASVLAAAIGFGIKAGTGLASAAFLIHGLPEMLSYFIGALAGGLAFQCLLAKKINFLILLNIFVLLAVAAAVLVLAAGMEVWLTPVVF